MEQTRPPRSASLHFEQPRIAKISLRPARFWQTVCTSSTRFHTTVTWSPALCGVAQATSTARPAQRQTFKRRLSRQEHPTDVETFGERHADHAAVQTRDVAVDLGAEAAAL